MTSKRVEKIMQLLFNSSEYLTAKYFSKILGVSVSTIYRDIDLIEFKLKKTNIILEKVPRKGFKVLGEKHSLKYNFDSTDFYIESHDFRKIQIFSNMLFLSDIGTYEQIADKFNVSIPTIRKDFYDISYWLNQYNVSFSKRKGGFSGEEINIQQCFNYNVLQIIKFNSMDDYQFEILFSNESIKIVKKWLDNFEIIDDSEYLKDSLMVSILTFFLRIKNGNHIGQDINFIFNQSNNILNYLPLINSLFTIEKNLKIKLLDSDIIFLSSILTAHKAKFYFGDEKRSIFQSEVIEKEIDSIIERVSNLLKVNLSQDKQLRRNLLQHVGPMLYRMSIGSRIRNPIKKEIINKYSQMYQIVSIASERMEEIIKTPFTDDEISFLVIYFEIAFERIKSKHRHRILIVCDFGISYSQFISQILLKHFSDRIIIETTNKNSLKDINLSNVDLIISNTDLKNFKYQVYYISKIPSTDQLVEIGKILNTPKKMISEERIELLSKEYCIPELIQLNLNLKTKSEIINFMGEKFIKVGLVSNNFNDSVMLRESMSSTDFIPNVAVPHANSEEVKKTFFGIVTLKEPIFWGENKIRLVVFISVTKKDVGRIDSVLRTLFNLLQKEKYIKDLLDISNKKEFISKFFNLES